MHTIKITPLIRYLLVFCVVAAATAVKPQVVKAALKPGWIGSCTFSHSLPDDPIVAFRQPGASHLHDFVGAKTTDAFSTYESLAAGGTTCAIPGDMSAYWVPALYEDGVQIVPQSNSGNNLFYYRRVGAPTGTVVQPIPPGLRIIIGNAKATSPQENPGLGSTIVFKCGPGAEDDIPLAAPPIQCASGILVISFMFPNCWDGVNLDSTDHRSHMSYPVNSSCPASHPVNLPRLEAFFRYIVGTGPIGTITLASGPYYTAHQDFFNAWQPKALQILITNCINAGIDCGINPPLPPGSISSTTSVLIGGANQGNYSIPPQDSLRPSYTGVDGGPVKVQSTNGIPIVAALRDAWMDGGPITSSIQLMGLPEHQLSDTYWFPAYNNVSLDNQLRFGNVGTSPTTVTVTIGGIVRGTYPLQPNQSARVNYPDLDSGPVKVQSSGGVKIIASIRDSWHNGMKWSSYAQLMGLPNHQLSDTYLFPAYNNVSLDDQLRFGNVGSAPTTVTVTIGGVVRGMYMLQPNESKRVNYDGLDSGPVVVQSSGGVPIIVSLRNAWHDGSKWTSYFQLMGLPQGQLSDTYLFPAYDNVSLDGQLRFGNVGTAPTTVTVTINGVVKGTYPLSPNQSVRVNYPGLNSGPIKVQSSGGVKIIASLRDSWRNGTKWTSYSQLMGLPGGQLSTVYLFPAYNNLTYDNELRIGVP